MTRHFFSCALTLLLGFVAAGNLSADDDWARWRGPQGNGIADQDQAPPTKWSSETNVVWKTKVPGRGHASPIVIDDKIFLATADKGTQTQSVICFARDSGEQIWETEVNQGGFPKKIHGKNTHASQTIATDRENLFVVFLNHDRIQLAALDLAGNLKWDVDTGAYVSQYPFGFGSSPVIHNGNVIVTSFNQKAPTLSAYSCVSGKEQWSTDLPVGSSYATPVIADVGGKEQLLLSGLNQVYSFDPATGLQSWTADGKWVVTCGTMVWNDDLVFASGGYPVGQTMGIKADGSGEIVWENNVRSYEQSMLIKDGYLYTHSDNGVVHCWRASDGTEMWKRKFGPRKNAESASPVYANGLIYFTDEKGETLVIKANAEQLEEVARNKLGDESFASMAICGNQIFTRVAIQEGETRQEWLYCLGEN